MRDIFFDLSVRSVRLNFLRSILASIGIVIGVVAISSMGMLGTNMQLSVKSQLSSNVNTIIITSDVVRTTTTAGTPITSQGIDKRTLNDIKSAAGQTRSSRYTGQIPSLRSDQLTEEVQFTDWIRMTFPSSSP